MTKKEWFVSLKKISPSDMEYYLEEKAAQGERLLPIGETGLFYFQFETHQPEKCKFVVDKSGLPKEMYKDTLEKKGWEYMGTTADFAVWRQSYTEKRPDDFTDYDTRAKHAKRIGMIFGAVGLACLVLFVLLIYGIYLEKAAGINTHIVMYAIQAVIQCPLILLFFWVSRKMMDFK